MKGCISHCEVADTPFHIQGDDIKLSWDQWFSKEIDYIPKAWVWSITFYIHAFFILHGFGVQYYSYVSSCLILQ